MSSKQNDIASTSLAIRKISREEMTLLRERIEGVIQDVLKLDMVSMAERLENQEKTATGLVVINDGDVGKVTDLALIIRTGVDMLDEKRKMLKDPFLQAGKIIDSIMKPLVDRGEAIIKHLRTKVELFKARQIEEQRRAEEAARKKAEEAARKAEAKGKTAPVYVPPPPVPTTVQSKQGAAQTKMVWTFEIVEPEKIPMEYWEVNEARIKSAIDAGLRDIPGVRIFQKPQIAFR